VRVRRESGRESTSGANANGRSRLVEEEKAVLLLFLKKREGEWREISAHLDEEEAIKADSSSFNLPLPPVPATPWNDD